LIAREIEKERESLKDFRETITEYETKKEALLGQIRTHLDRGMGYQLEIEKLTALTKEDLRKVGELSANLLDLRQRAEDKLIEIKTKLKDRYGFAPEASSAAPSAHREENGLGADLEQELSKLKKIKELFEKDMTADFSSFDPAPMPEMMMAGDPLAVSEEPNSPHPAMFEAGPSPAEFKIPEINQFIRDFVQRENEAPAPEPFPEPIQARGEERKAQGDEINFQAVFETLEKYRKSEPTDYNGEISYFQTKERIILDGESLVRAVSCVQDAARKLVQKLAQTESPKDQFFLKQELINNQEGLRKIILRSVRMCEKENGALPRYTADVLNVGVLKEILEKLNMDNWSNQDDFRAFEDYVDRLKDMFYKRITPPANYLQSIVDELER
jgi:hypothetical protein